VGEFIDLNPIVATPGDHLAASEKLTSLNNGYNEYTMDYNGIEWITILSLENEYTMNIQLYNGNNDYKMIV
jgi:hypothetical protein